MGTLFLKGRNIKKKSYQKELFLIRIKDGVIINRVKDQQSLNLLGGRRSVTYISVEKQLKSLYYVIATKRTICYNRCNRRIAPNQYNAKE